MASRRAPAPAMTALDAWLHRGWSHEADRFTVESDDGVKLACRGWNMDADDKPAILLVHGFRAHARWWDHIAPRLADSYRVMAFDFSGMGDSGNRSQYSRLVHAGEIASVIDRAGLGRPIIIAHSYGGQVALIAAATSPERIWRVILIDSKIPLATDSAAVRPYPRRSYESLDAGIARFRLTPASENPVPELMAYVARHSLRQDAGAWTWKVDAAIGGGFDNANCRDMIMGQRIAVDMIFGEESPVVSPERLVALREIAPLLGAPVGIPFARHHIMLEQPVALTCAIRGLLARRTEMAVADREARQ